MPANKFSKDLQYYKFCLYGFLKNQRFFELYLLLILHNEKGLSLTLVGVIYSVRLILRSLLEIPSGFLADAMGRRGVMLFSYGCYMLSFTLYYLAESFAILLIPTVLFGIGDAFRTGTHKAMIFEYLKIKGWKDQKVSYYGHTRGWSQTGSAISSLIATLIIWYRPTYNIVFLYTLIPYTLGFILLASYPRRLEGGSGKKLKWKNAYPEILNVIKESIGAFRKLENVRIAANISSFTGLYFALKDYLQLIVIGLVAVVPLSELVNLGQEKQEKILLGLAYSILYFLTAGASRNAGRLSDRFSNLAGYLNLILLTGFIVGFLSGISYSLDWMIPSLILFTGIYIVQNLQRPAGVSLISDRFDEKILASVLSIESQLGSLIGAVLSITVGFLADRMGAGIAIASVAGLLLIVFPLISLKKK